MGRNLEDIQDLPDRCWECDRRLNKSAIAPGPYQQLAFGDRTLLYHKNNYELRHF
ncbi:MAG: hypothetical protein ACRC62_26875 [Microcoleus sp.]